MDIQLHTFETFDFNHSKNGFYSSHSLGKPKKCFSFRSECLIVECEDGDPEIFHFELTIPPDDDYKNRHLTKLVLVKKSEGEAWVDIGVSTGDGYKPEHNQLSISKRGRILKEGQNEDVFKNFCLGSTCGNSLALHFEIIICKSSFELID